MKLINELERLRDFLHGAHLATNDDNAGGVLHQACHKIDDILKGMAENQRLNYDVLFGTTPYKEAKSD